MTRYMPMYVQDGSYPASQDRRLISALWPGPASTGCAVTVSSGMTLSVAAGMVAVPTQNNTGSTLCVSDAYEQVVVPAAPPSGQTRIDLVVCRPRDFDLDGSSNADFIFDVVSGTAATTGSQTVPATPAGTAALYQITVPGGAASIVAGNLADVRPGNMAIPTPWPRENYSRTYGASSASPNPAWPTRTISGRSTVTSDSGGNGTLAMGPVWAEAGVSPAPTSIVAIHAVSVGFSVQVMFPSAVPWTDLNNISVRLFTTAGVAYQGTIQILFTLTFQNGAT
jgi:hypothetical protein